MPDYAAPYQAEVGSSPTFEEMQMIVVRAKRRPKFPEVWKDTNQVGQLWFVFHQYFRI